MKILKFIGILLLLVLVIGLIAGAFVKNDFHFEKTISINAPKDKVWQNILLFENHEKWSQWKKLDSAMTTEITGMDGTVGAKMSWKSKHKDVGDGSQTIKAIQPGERIDYDLDLGSNGKPTSYFKLSGDSTQTQVTWALDVHAPYPFNAIAAIVMKENQMDKMFDTGLMMLKTASEK